MSDYTVFSKNKAALDRCNKVYKWVFIAVLAASVATVGYALFNLLISLLALDFGAFFALLICGVILSPLSGAMIIYSGYVRNDVYAYLSPLPVGVGMFFAFLLCGDNLWKVTCLCIVAVVASIAPTLLANARYRYLEEQEGFPHFSVLLMEQQIQSEELKRNDPYMEAAKRRKAAESDSMNDLSITGETISEKVTEKKNYMDEI